MKKQVSKPNIDHDTVVELDNDVTNIHDSSQIGLN